MIVIFTRTDSQPDFSVLLKVEKNLDIGVGVVTAECVL